MSVTVYRYKDGQKIPIKVSIFDAFRSIPPRRPKVVQPEKKPQTKPSAEKKGPIPKAGIDDNIKKDDNNHAKNHSAHDEESYTDEDNATIIAMKAKPGTSWNDIKDAIGKQSVFQLKEHYKLHLGPNAAEEQKKHAQRLAKAEKNRAEGLVKQAEGGVMKGDGADKGANGGDDGGGTYKKNKVGDVGGGEGVDGKQKVKEKAKAKAHEGRTQDKDTPKNLTAQNLRNFVKKYEKDKWLAAASRHYDLTGQRISPEAAKKMLEEK